MPGCLPRFERVGGFSLHAVQLCAHPVDLAHARFIDRRGWVVAVEAAWLCRQRPERVSTERSAFEHASACQRRFSSSPLLRVELHSNLARLAVPVAHHQRELHATPAALDVDLVDVAGLLIDWDVCDQRHGLLDYGRRYPLPAARAGRVPLEHQISVGVDSELHRDLSPRPIEIVASLPVIDQIHAVGHPHGHEIGCAANVGFTVVQRAFDRSGRADLDAGSLVGCDGGAHFVAVFRWDLLERGELGQHRFDEVVQLTAALAPHFGTAGCERLRGDLLQVGLQCALVLVQIDSSQQLRLDCQALHDHSILPLVEQFCVADAVNQIAGALDVAHSVGIVAVGIGHDIAAQVIEDDLAGPQRRHRVLVENH